MFIRHRPTDHCIEFYKWAPPLRSFCEYEPSKYYLILREGKHCNSSEFQCARQIIERKVDEHRIKLTEGDKGLIMAEIGPNAELGGDLIKSIYREAFVMPNNNLRASFIGRVNIRLRGPLAGWNDRTTLTAKKNAEQKNTRVSQICIRADSKGGLRSCTGIFLKKIENILTVQTSTA